MTAKPKIRILVALVALLACLQPLAAAEVKGTVTVDYRGLFSADSGAQSYPVSVALEPAAGQKTIRRAARRQVIEIIDNRMRPAFITVQKGDHIRFINRDSVFHEVFSLSPGEPVSVRLGKTKEHNASTELVLDQVGTTHFFCRIHNKSYARVDVVDTSYLQMIQPGQVFHFVGLSPGKWTLRLASPAGETRRVPVTAMTSPPPLQLTIASRDGGFADSRLKPQAGIEQLYPVSEW
ncbi:MAG TPA: hypothetical protein ENJ80_09900 [Gammaproteobacteria bacterium]|nr:hypothetical protein [Gammaproteobacteria bacterium]